MSQPVRYERDADIGLIRVANPPVNALSHAVRHGLEQALAEALADGVAALVLLCEGRTFFAGADINEFDLPPRAPMLDELLVRFDASPVPIVAALHGTALGGGFETALACHYRCAMKTARVGLPEVKLGLLPGAGGTQRVPRAAGVEVALQMISGGRPLTATEAAAVGLIDRVFDDGDLESQARAFARDIIGAPPPRLSARRIDPADVPSGTFAAWRAKLAQKTRGQLAPDLIVRCIEAAVEHDFTRGMEIERELFSECLRSPQSAAMRHAFFAERAAARVAGLPRDVQARRVRKVGVVGAGTMGGGIAMCFAGAGCEVRLLEVSDDALSRGLATVRRNYEFSVARGRISAAEVAALMSRIHGTTDYADLADVDLVIEAVFEDPQLKREVFRNLDQVCRPGAILATNTSYQDIDEIAAVTARPADVIGMHFFSPANVMRLLEVVRTRDSADEVVATAMQLARHIGKVPVLARVCYGFIGNRLLEGYLREAQLMLLEGAAVEQIDAAAEAFGMAMGPLAVCDLAGLDIGYKARQARGELPPASRYVSLGDRLVEAGRLGQKTGAGFYSYDSATRRRSVDPVVAALIAVEAERHGVTQRDFDNDAIVERLMLPLINEGARVLEEGIAQRPGDIDIVYVHGYGFPAHRGGPMYYADTLGPDRVFAAVCRLRDTLEPVHWAPATLLESLARERRSFAEWQQQRDA